MLMLHSKGAVPKYRKHRSGQARVTINGRDYYLGPWKSRTSKDAYDQIVGEYLSTGRSPNFGLKSQDLTVAMIMADYVNHARNYYGDGKDTLHFGFGHGPESVCWQASRRTGSGADRRSLCENVSLSFGLAEKPCASRCLHQTCGWNPRSHVASFSVNGCDATPVSFFDEHGRSTSHR